MMENKRKQARRQIDATILELMKGIEQDALGKPKTPTQDPGSPTTIVNVNVYLCGHKAEVKGS